MSQAEHQVWLERINRALSQLKRTPPSESGSGRGLSSEGDHARTESKK